jgi:GLPGLI family protein
MLRLFIYILLLNLAHNSQAQDTYRITYKVIPINIIENNEVYSKNKTENLKKLLENTINYAKNERFLLYANKGHSYFTKAERIDIDFADKSTIMYSKAARLITFFNKEVFVNYKLNSLAFTRTIAGSDYNVKKNEFYNFKWDIKNETKEILGFQAKKAIGIYYDIIRDKEFKIVAWFIPAIPIPSGPDIYLGLPGLIGEIQLRKSIVKIESIETIEKVIQKPNLEDFMTYIEYKKLVAKGKEIVKKDFN